MNKATLAALGVAAVLISTPLISSAQSTTLQDQINSLLSQIKTLQLKLADLLKVQGSGTVSTTVVDPTPGKYRICTLLARNLSAGASGEDVMSLQEFLQGEGYLSANASGYFGRLTADAVARWQTSQGLSAAGMFGPLSRERLKIWCGGNQSGGLSASPEKGQAPLAISFSFNPETDESAQYYIEYGDGTGEKMTLQQIYCIRAPCISPHVSAHTYTSAGSYTVYVSRYIACLYSNPRCMVAQPPPIAKTQVTVTGSQSGNKPPVISGFSGPTSLTLNEQGTWKISASDPENGSLSYSIKWGDEWYGGDLASRTSAAPSIVQSTTFTHSYSTAGTYTVFVTVSDQSGQSAQTTATVQVGNSLVACTKEYMPVCGRPNGCANSCPPGMYCTLICQLHNPVTYGNRCELNAANATFLHEGVCTGNESGY